MSQFPGQTVDGQWPDQNPHQRALRMYPWATPPTPAPQAAPAPTRSAGPWNRGEIRGAARQGADFARLGGGFGKADTDSMKHTFGRIAQNFDTSDAGLQALMQDEEFRRLFPQARLEKDWIDFGGQIDPHTGQAIGKIDVMRAWRQGGRGDAWQWLPEAEALAGAQGPGAGRGAPLMAGQSDLMAQILASLGSMQQPDGQELLLQQLAR